MADDNNGDFLKFLFGAAAVGLGALAITRLAKQAGNAEDDEAQALRDFSRPMNPFDPDDVQRHNDALTRMKVARAQQKIRELQKSGYPVDPQMEQAMLDMARYENDWSLDGFLNYRDATVRLANSPLPEPNYQGPSGGPTRQPSRMKCGYCDGAGWYICGGCRGIGRNPYVSSPHYTGDTLADAIISLQHDRTCTSCFGQGQKVCPRCNGRKYLD